MRSSCQPFCSNIFANSLPEIDFIRQFLKFGKIHQVVVAPYLLTNNLQPLCISFVRVLQKYYLGSHSQEEQELQPNNPFLLCDDFDFHRLRCLKSISLIIL